MPTILAILVPVTLLEVVALGVTAGIYKVLQWEDRATDKKHKSPAHKTPAR